MPTPDWNKHYCAGKGSWRRPEDREKFEKNFDRIFRSEPEETPNREKESER